MWYVLFVPPTKIGYSPYQVQMVGQRVLQATGDIVGMLDVMGVKRKKIGDIVVRVS